MTRVNIDSSNRDDSDALELALAFVDEFDLLGDDQDNESRRAATAAVTMTDGRRQKAKRTRTSPSSQTRKPEPTATAAAAMSSTPRATAESAAPKALNRKDELTYLRAKVRELQVRFELLQSTSSSRSEDSARNDDEDEEKASYTEQETEQRPLSPKLLAQHRTMWENLATRQSKEREKAEHENAQLKALLESQLKVAKGLERMLRKRGNVEVRIVSYNSVVILELEANQYIVCAYRSSARPTPSRRSSSAETTPQRTTWHSSKNRQRNWTKSMPTWTKCSRARASTRCRA